VVNVKEARAAWEPREKSLVVLGQPGSGKTWLVARLTLEGLDRRRPAAAHAAAGAGLLPLRVTCRELGESLARDPGLTLREAVERIVSVRVADFDALAAEPFRRLVQDRFRQHQVLLLADGWDECPPAHQPRLRQALRTWSEGSKGRLVLTSRPLGFPNGMIPGANTWRLQPLEWPGGVQQLVRLWQPGSGDELMRRLESDPGWQTLTQVPLFGALVCRIGGPGGRLPIGQTQFLDQYLKELLHQAYRGGNLPADTIAPQAVRVLAHLAFTTYHTSPWVVEVEALQKALEDGPCWTAGESVLAVQHALIHDFPLFAGAGTGRLQIQHQVFADFLFARWVAQEVYPREPDREAWLREQAAAGLPAERHEVLRHLAALVADPEPLLRALLRRHRRDRLRRLVQRGKPRVPVALCLAGYCLAAAGPKGWKSRTGQRVLVTIVKRWKRSDLPQYRALTSLLPALGNNPDLTPEEVIHDVLTEVAKAGSVDFAVLALRDPDGSIRQRAVNALGATGPSAAPWTPELVAALHDRRVPFPLGDWIMYAISGCVCGRFLDLSAGILSFGAPDCFGTVLLVAAIACIGLLLSSGVWVPAMKRGDQRRAAWLACSNAADVLGGLGSAASPVVGDLAQAVRDDPTLATAAEALARVGPEGVAELARLLRDANPGVRKVAAEVWKKMPDRPCPAGAGDAPDRRPPALAAPRRQLPAWVKIAVAFFVGIVAGVIFRDAEGVLRLLKSMGYYDGHSVSH
jgi:hypothetical protein